MKTLCASVIACALLVAMITAQVGIGGDGWSLKPTASLERVHLSIKRTREKGTWHHGTDIPVSSLRGFSLDQFANGGRAHFELVRDAGKFLCDGEFSWGRGSGEYRFEPDPDFTAALVKMGYEMPDSDQLFSMMLSDIKLVFARNIRGDDPTATIRDLIDLRNHGVTFDYIHEARQAGFTALRTRDFIDLRNHGVPVAFLRDVKAAGYEIDTRQIIDLRNHGVSSEYLRDIQRAGLHPETADIIRFRDHGVDPTYLKILHDNGYTDLSAQQITELRNHGVPAEFIEDVKKLGYQFNSRDLIKLRDHGVNGDYLRKLRESGMTNLNAAQIAKLRQHGID